MISLTTLSIAPALAVLASTAPQPHEVKSFGDWVAGCDNGLTCQAQALLPTETLQNKPVVAFLTRAAGPDGALTFAIENSAPQEKSYQILVDGVVVHDAVLGAGQSPIQITGSAALSFARTLARGKRMEVRDGKGNLFAQISLKGSLSALRYLDSRQKRTGTSGAIVSVGKRNRRLPVPLLPVVSRGPVSPTSFIPEADWLVRLAESSACGVERTGVTQDNSWSLGRQGDSHVALVQISCGSGAYNRLSAIYIGRYDSSSKEKKGWVFQPARFDYLPPDQIKHGPPVLMNVEWDAEHNVLSSVTYGRSLGDCGYAEHYIWTGSGFRLAQEKRMDPCSGSRHWITTWRATIDPE